MAATMILFADTRKQGREVILFARYQGILPQFPPEEANESSLRSLDCPWSRQSRIGISSEFLEDIARSPMTSPTVKCWVSLKRPLPGSFIFRGFSSTESPRLHAPSTRLEAEAVQVLHTKQFRVNSISSKSTTTTSYSQEIQEATKLTDSLLDFTRTLMNGSQHHIIAYSGGIDSSVVAALLHRVQTPGESVQAVLGLSPAVPSDQVALAEEVARAIGIPLEQIPTTEGSDATYIKNSGEACLACKTHLYTCLNSIAQHASDNSKRLYNGTNADDLNDPTRLGLIAAERFEVRSPLRHTPKEKVRLVGKHLGLPNWNYAASPCLRSRLAIGVEAIPQHLQRIERAESYVRGELSLDATHDLRVRLLSHNRAMIEVEEQFLDTAEATLEMWQGYFCDALGFASVNVRSFKSGSVAKVVEPSFEQQEVAL